MPQSRVPQDQLKWKTENDAYKSIGKPDIPTNNTQHAPFDAKIVKRRLAPNQTRGRRWIVPLEHYLINWFAF